MDSKEAQAYFTTADEQLKDAQLAFRAGSHSLCALLSSASAENATSALLIAIGERPSRKHRNSLVLHKIAQDFKPEMRSELMDLVEEMKVLEPHITKARYPIMRGPDLLPPSKFYTGRMAKDLLARARRSIKLVKLVLAQQAS